MTMTGNTEETLKENPVGYLDIAEFIQFSGSQNKKDLAQLWKRIVFSIAISNPDDHLRNHGFILTNNGWILSPAFDINPSTDKSGLALNIDTDNNALDFELAKSVGEYFQLTTVEMDTILNEVLIAVGNWRTVANAIGIPKREQEMMASAFSRKT
jgi:serine/threonine-protein kinase HipA